MPRPCTPKAWYARTQDSGYDVICRHAPQLALIVAPKGNWGAPDAAIAAAYLELLANAHKVGCCWGGYVCFAMAHPTAHQLRAFAGVQEDEQVYAAQMMDFPACAPFQVAPQGAAGRELAVKRQARFMECQKAPVQVQTCCGGLFIMGRLLLATAHGNAFAANSPVVSRNFFNDNHCGSRVFVQHPL